jgi:hypothetical protein
MLTKPLHTAAVQIKDTFGDPGTFLQFLCDALTCANQYPEPDHQKNGIFLLQRLIESIAIPWTKCQTPETEPELIEVGLKILHESWGSITYYEELGHISLAQIYNANTSGNPTESYAMFLLEGMKALYSIGEAFNEFDSKEKKAA